MSKKGIVHLVLIGSLIGAFVLLLESVGKDVDKATAKPIPAKTDAPAPARGSE